MARTEPVTLTNMCRIIDKNGCVLLQDRQKDDWPGMTFPGGHIERKESITASVIREVKEETGLQIKNPKLCGIKQFHNEHGRYLVFLYTASEFEGTLVSSKEGDVFWVKEKDLDRYPLAEDMKELYTIFTSEDYNEFYYYEEDGIDKYKIL